MSLLSPEIRVALLPDRAGVASRGRAPLARASTEGGLPALDGLLAESRPRGRARIALSHHHARLFLLPPPTVHLRRGEMRPWLRARLADSLGGGFDDVTANWRLTWDAAAPGRPVLVAAVENALLEALAVTLGRHGLGLAGVQPWLAAAWNRRRELWRASGWYAMLEPGRVTLLRLSGGHPVGLRQRQCGFDRTTDGTTAATADIAAELRALLTRESLLAGVPDTGDLWLERAGVAGDWSSLAGSHGVHELAGPVDPALALLP